MTGFRTLAAAIAALLAFGTPAEAQRHRPFIQLFQAGGFGGRSLWLTSSVSDLRWYNFNNRAASARVSGRWRLCDRPHFRGHCTTISSNRSSLPMRGRVQSVRFISW